MQATGRKERRQPGSVAGSILLHLLAAWLLWSVRISEHHRPHYAVTPLFLPASPRSAPVALATPLPKLIVPRRQFALAMPPAALPALTLPAPPIAIARPRMAESQPPPPASAPASSAVVSAPKPSIRTGVFADVDLTRQVATPQLQVAAAGFDQAPNQTPSQGTPAVASDAGFGPAGAVPESRSRVSLTSTSGFGEAGTRPVPAANTSRPVSAGQFETARVVASARPTPAGPAGRSAPLEILFKPRPAYSADGRSERIEGEVVLEVLFGASGATRVLRVVRRLGYGLEENAIRAAEGIRFRPAIDDGRAVDTVATVRIGFHLAY